MSTNTDAVNQFYVAFGTGDLDACAQLLTEDVVVHEPPELPYGGEHSGRSGFKELITAIVTDFELVVTDGPVATEAPDGRVVGLLRATFTNRESRDVVDMRLVEVHTLRDGLIAEIDVYYWTPQAIGELKSRAMSA